MKSLLLSEYNHLEVTELPTPAAGPGEVLVRVEACGICGSDVHGYDGSSGRRIPPIVMGHEAAGTVASIGEGVTNYALGDRVTFDSTVYCGACAWCKHGLVNLCDNRQVIGVSCGDYRRHGAFAEYVAVPQRILYHLPANLSFTEAAMLEAASVALHAVRVSEAHAGDTALVLGAGMIGLLTLQAARAAGCARVLIADVDATRLNLAKQVGADEALHCSGAELVAKVFELTAGLGVDHTYEAVGRNETVSAAIDCTRKGGTVTLIGNIQPEVTLPLQKVVTRQIRLQGSCASAGEYPQAIELIASGRMQVSPLITAVAPLEEGPRWFERLHAREPNLMKVILTPGTI
ncbi:Alcohol dehydrogenase zinc-binding domain protein [Candidatus Sulfotelmatomonas gaucii]|uniref:Alcohol dehydrogenase zinc-binding domain protein n=1 Tax=Candidatus Sulfuritelmatomonas gaucii TaxID=2043161 RepID=A0A2N9LE98_9BACT|nr:Alcohol dehydrogenase zinc-binding domain protein [Candidatus Sulfotelmatomonas gaucii]